jgi:hypothetical protein
MLQQLLFALAVASMTIVVHATGTVRIVVPLAGVWRRREGHPTSARTVLILTRLVGGLLVLHLAETAVWAAAFRAAGVMPTFESSFCYSLESYTTVGYGNLVPQESWRLVGPVESAVGIMMFGWSTGIIVAAVQRIYSGRAG